MGDGPRRETNRDGCSGITASLATSVCANLQLLSHAQAAECRLQGFADNSTTFQAHFLDPMRRLRVTPIRIDLYLFRRDGSSAHINCANQSEFHFLLSFENGHVCCKRSYAQVVTPEMQGVQVWWFESCGLGVGQNLLAQNAGSDAIQ